MDIKIVISKNISELRRSRGLTQLQLAEKLNYSDKAVSKWESGASLPDIVVLKEIADLFGVSVDSLLSEDAEIVKQPEPEGRGRVHFVITALSVVLVWLIGTIAFVGLGLAHVNGPLWLSFVWPLPVTFIVILVMNSIWGNRRKNYLIISLLMWSLLAATYLSAVVYNPWLVFVLGVPGQIIIVLWSKLKKNK